MSFWQKVEIFIYLAFFILENLIPGSSQLNRAGRPTHKVITQLEQTMPQLTDIRWTYNTNWTAGNLRAGHAIAKPPTGLQTAFAHRRSHMLVVKSPREPTLVSHCTKVPVEVVVTPRTFFLSDTSRDFWRNSWGRAIVGTHSSLA